MAFFDFHMHTTLKSFFSVGDKKLNPWEKIPEKHIPLKLCADLAKYLLQSQGDLRQLSDVGCNLFGFAFFFPDTAMVDNRSVRWLAKKMPDEFDKNLYDDIVNKKLSPYPTILKEVKEVLFNPSRFGVHDVEVLRLSHPNNYVPDNKKLFVFFVVEGCHTLSNTQETSEFNVDEMISNLDDLRSQFPVFSVNLTHIENSKICNQAFGMQFENDKRFRPFQKGIGADGWKMIRHCYENKIIADVKHMSMGARRELYAQWFDPASAIQNIKQPLICTHAGFTGISWTEIPDYIYKVEKSAGNTSVYISMAKPYKPFTGLCPSFNASSINLYNEDIENIILSGGIIGLNLDKRILGYQQPGTPMIELSDDLFPFEEEYVSVQELNLFYSKTDVNRISSKIDDAFSITWQRVEEGSETATEIRYHLLHFVMHVVHFCKVIQLSTKGIDVNKALTQICIGSDFDGLINPIWCCLTVEEIGNLKASFKKEFIPLANDLEVKLPAGFDIDSFTENLFFNNGSNFIFSRLELFSQQ